MHTTHPDRYLKKPQHYQITPYQYKAIKNWLNQSTKNYYKLQQQPAQSTIKDQTQYTTSAYVYSFKAIQLQDRFVNHNFRAINNIADEGSGLIVIANIYDEVKKCYVTRSFERKYIKCMFDNSSNLIKLNEPIVMSFYLEHHKNIMKFGQNFIINLQIITFQGRMVQLGTVSHDLSHRPKHILKDFNIKKGDEVIGKIQFMIDSPDSKIYILKHLIPPNRIISQQKQQSILPPCVKYSLHNKVSPFTLSESLFPIVLQNLKIKIKNYKQFMVALQRNSPFFIDFHYEDVGVQIEEFRVLLGYHNTWMFLTHFGSLSSSEPKEARSPNKMKKKQYINQNRSPSKNKGSNESNLLINNLSKYYTLKQLNPTQNPSQITLIPNNNRILMYYYHGTNGHLGVVFQAKIKYSLNMTIKQEKTKVYNLGWHPIVFGIEQNTCLVEVPLITHQVKFPGFNIINLRTQKTDSPFSLQYQAINNNDSLHKLFRKQSHKMIAYGSFASMNSFDQINKVLSGKGSLATQLEKQQNQTLQSKALKQQNQRMQKLNKYSMNTESSVPTQNKYEEIGKILSILSYCQKSRVEVTGTQIPIPMDDLTYFPSKSQIFNKKITIMIKFYGILPHTETLDPEQPVFRMEQSKDQLPPPDYYIPRTMLVELFVYGQHYSFYCQIDHKKNSVKYCVPIQMSCSKVTDHCKTKKKIMFSSLQDDSIVVGKTTTQLQISLTISNQKQYNAFLQAPILCQVFDVQNYQFYAQGTYPFINLLSESSDNPKQTLNSNEEHRFTKLPSFAKKLTTRYNEPFKTQKQSEQRYDGQVDKVQTIDSKKLGNLEEDDKNKIKNFKIQLWKHQSSQQIGQKQMRGSLLFTAKAQITTIPHNQTNPSVTKIQQFKLQKIAKDLPIKQRQLLRINNYNKYGGGHGNIAIDKNQLISKYKENNQKKFVQEYVRNQCHNDIIIGYQLGVPIYEWLEFINTDTSGNDVFTFQIDCQFVEIVVDSAEYNQQSAIQANKQNSISPLDKKIRKNPYLTYHYAQNNYGYYEGRVVYGQRYHLLMKICQQQWSEQMETIKIVYLTTKRNKQTYKKYKIRLDYQQPIITHIEQIQCLFKMSDAGVHVPLPQSKLFGKFSQNIKSLTTNVSYSKKNRCLVIQESKRVQLGQERALDLAEEDFMPLGGKIYDVLVGFYWDKKFQNLMNVVLIRVEILSGEKITTHIGQISTFPIPFYQLHLPINSRIYRTQTSHNKILFNPKDKYSQQFRILSNKTAETLIPDYQSSQPQITICPMNPIQQQNLIVSVISFQRKLLRKYLIQISVQIPRVSQYQQIKLTGMKGERSLFMLRNPYQIDFEFQLICSCPELLRFNLSSVQEHQKYKRYAFKISAQSQLKAYVEVKHNISSHNSRNIRHTKDDMKIFREEFIVLIDSHKHVVGIYRILFVQKQSRKDSVRENNFQNDLLMIQKDQLFSLFGPRVSQATI